jgi:hypothetical protein
MANEISDRQRIAIIDLIPIESRHSGQRISHAFEDVRVCPDFACFMMTA